MRRVLNPGNFRYLLLQGCWPSLITTIAALALAFIRRLCRLLMRHHLMVIITSIVGKVIPQSIRRTIKILKSVLWQRTIHPQVDDRSVIAALRESIRLS